MKCPKCGFVRKPGRPPEINRDRVKFFLKRGHTLREIAERLGVSHGAIALIRKELMKTSKLVLILIASLTLTSACATGSYKWKLDPNKTDEQAQADLAKCAHYAELVPNGRFGHGQYDFTVHCMKGQGHNLVYVND